MEHIFQKGTRGKLCTLCSEVNTHPVHLRIVTLKDTDLGQIIDGLTARAESYEWTANFLDDGQELVDDERVIEEVSNADEARKIAAYYRELISKLEGARTV